VTLAGKSLRHHKSTVIISIAVITFLLARLMCCKGLLRGRKKENFRDIKLQEKENTFNTLHTITNRCLTRQL